MNTIKYICLFLFLANLLSCEKYLDVKRDSNRAVPSNIRDYQLLLDFNNTMNNSSSNAPEILSDDYYLSEADLNSITNANDRGMYGWDANDENGGHWQPQYRAILHTNIALEGLENINPSPSEIGLWEETKATAHFFRAFYLEGVLQIFSLPYNSTTARNTPGVPIRLTSDFNVRTTRGTVQEGYDQVLNDLRISLKYLPNTIPFKTRPNKAAAYGLMARVFLTMNQYDSSKYYSEKFLQLYDSLLNYNDLNPNATAPFSPFNKEIVFFCRSLVPTILVPTRAKIDSNLINSYRANDLRFNLYYRLNTDGTYRFKGDYGGSGVNSGYSFTGIVTDEQYLILAESLVRLDDIETALYWLNRLLVTRYRTGFYIPISIQDKKELLSLIIMERRKSLVFRSARWRDLRRLSIDPEMAIIPKRIVGGVLKELQPGSNGYRQLLPTGVKQTTNLVDFP